MTRNDIENVLNNFGSNRRIFCSEADFQFSLAWELQKSLPSAKVLLEKCIQCGGNLYYVDLIILEQGKHYYIELKYQTSELAHGGSMMPLLLKQQAAEDLKRYDYLWDIYRLCNIANNLPLSFGGAFAIILTNDHLMYDAPSTYKATLDSNFRIHDRRYPCRGTWPVPGLVAWNNASLPSSHWTKTGERSQRFTVPPISTVWKDYCSIIDSNGKQHKFKYLINEVTLKSAKSIISPSNSNSCKTE